VSSFRRFALPYMGCGMKCGVFSPDLLPCRKENTPVADPGVTATVPSQDISAAQQRGTTHGVPAAVHTGRRSKQQPSKVTQMFLDLGQVC